jgi:tetratricopeptide (TPR) repeat protein
MPAANFKMTTYSWFALLRLPMRPVVRKLIPACTRIVLAILGLSATTATLVAQAPVEPHSKFGVLTVRTLDAGGQAVADARIALVDESGNELAGRTGNDGSYRFSRLEPGKYEVRAESPGFATASLTEVVLALKDTQTVLLKLQRVQADGSNSSPISAPEFFDKPQFTASGVTDTSNLGGHGSNTRLPTSEALARATTSLKSQEPEAATSPDSVKLLRREADRAPTNFDLNYKAGAALLAGGHSADSIAYLERAAQLRTDDAVTSELTLAYAQAGEFERARTLARGLLAKNDSGRVHHLLATVEERAGNPLQAAKEFQRAAELDPIESHLFDWGSELLLHHAFTPAAEVFSKGNRLFPRSQRILIGLAMARYSTGDDEQAVQRLCEASDVDPSSALPYEFMGRVLASSNIQSAGLNSRLARFAELQPNNALANYYYALSLWKESRIHPNESDESKVERLLENATRLDPQLGPAYLQLGIIYADSGDLRQALQPLTRAVEVSPDLPDAHYRLGRVYSLLGQKANAQHEFSLYDKTSKAASAELERQRREVRQLVFTLQPDHTGAPSK